MMFENSLCEHQFSSLKCSGRPTIEVDIMPDFISDTSLNITELMGGIHGFRFKIQTIVLII